MMAGSLGQLGMVAMGLVGLVSVLRARRDRKANRTDQPMDAVADKKLAERMDMERRMAAYLASRDRTAG